MSHEWLVSPKEFQVGTKEYKKFRNWLQDNEYHYKNSRLTSLKREYLMEYLIEYLNEVSPQR